MRHGRRFARAGLLLAAAAAVAGGALLVLARRDPSPTSALAFEAFATAAILALLAGSGSSLSRRPLASRLGLGPGRLSRATLVAVGAGFVAVSHGVEGVLRLLELRDTGALAELDLRLRDLTPRQLGFAIVGLGVAPGVGEELFFRGFVQRGLEPLLGGALAVGATSVAFGALHWDPVHATAALVLGLYLGVVTLWSASVRPAIGCHVINNLIAVLEGSLAPGPLVPSGAAVAIGLGLGLPALLAAWREAGRLGSEPVARSAPGDPPGDAQGRERASPG